LGFEIWGLGFRVQSHDASGEVESLGFKVPVRSLRRRTGRRQRPPGAIQKVHKFSGSGFKVWGLGLWLWGIEFRV